MTEDAATVSDDRSAPWLRASTFRTAAALIVLLALLVRVVYVTTAVVDIPIRGDINQYVLHAWNLAHRGTYSTTLPTGEDNIPDDHRGPGYPLLIAAAMLVSGHSDLPLREGPQNTAILGYASDTWMQIVYAIQILLGAATALLTIAIGRFWLGRGPSLCAGLVVAVWPHLVVASGVLLSEALFAFMCALAIFAVLRMLISRSLASALLAGVCFGFTFLVNPVVAAFPIFVAVLVFLASSTRVAFAFLTAFLILPAAWSLANTHPLDGLRSRAGGPFVIGSWPQFYDAYNTRFRDPISASIIEAYSEEQKAFDADPHEGLRMMRERMALDPTYYARWYLFGKPYLLWDWDIRIGPGGFYTMETRNSPFERNPVLRGDASVLKALNPWFFFSALIGAIAVISRFLARPRDITRHAPIVVAALFFYVTIVYSILQSEPRYSIAFRPFEILLSITMVAAVIHAVHEWRARSIQTRSA